MESESEKIDLPDNCKACNLMWFHCDFACWYGSEECLKNIRHYKKKGVFISDLGYKKEK